jgi:hypothetical protein
MAQFDFVLKQELPFKITDLIMPFYFKASAGSLLPREKYLNSLANVQGLHSCSAYFLSWFLLLWPS